MVKTHRQRADRREAIAEAVRAGDAPREVALEFGVSMGTVYHACQAGGVALTRRPVQRRVTVRTLAVLAELQNTTDRGSAIAERHGVSRQWVCELQQRAQAAGLRFARDATAEGSEA